jgi:hypothetical protein
LNSFPQPSTQDRASEVKWGWGVESLGALRLQPRPMTAGDFAILAKTFDFQAEQSKTFQFQA